MDRAIIPIKKNKITEVGFNQYDFYYRINATDYVWCINWSDFLKKKETYIDWYVRLPLLEVTTQTPSSSLPSDEEKKKLVINKILHDLPIREVRGEMSPNEWYGWFEEVYDKAFSIASTRIAEMEREVKRLRFMIDNGLGSKDIQNDI